MTGSASGGGEPGRRAVDLVVSGRVQGVFYRASMRTEAERLGVTGWVRNEDDGTVRAHVEGPGSAVADLVEWCRSGPPQARVSAVDVRDGDLDGSATFED